MLKGAAIAAIGVGTAVGLKGLAEKGPGATKPAARSVIRQTQRVTESTKKKVNGLVKKYGWAAFWGALGAAAGANVTASLVGSSKRKKSTSRGGQRTSEEHVRAKISPWVKSGAIGAGAIGGAAHPITAISVAGLKYACKVWQALSPEERSGIIDRLKDIKTRK